MKKIYRLLGLITNYRFALPVSRASFTKLLKPHVAEDVGSGLDIFSLSNAGYKGFVGHDEFYLRKKRGFAKRQDYYCKVYGKLIEENGLLLVELEIRYFPPLVYFYFIVGGFFIFGATIGLLISFATLSLSTIGTSIFNLFFVGILLTIIGSIIRSSSLQTIEKMRIELQSNFQQYTMEK